MYFSEKYLEVLHVGKCTGVLGTLPICPTDWCKSPLESLSFYQNVFLSKGTISAQVLTKLTPSQIRTFPLEVITIELHVFVFLKNPSVDPIPHRRPRCSSYPYLQKLSGGINNWFMHKLWALVFMKAVIQLHCVSKFVSDFSLY